MQDMKEKACLDISYDDTLLDSNVDLLFSTEITTPNKSRSILKP